MQAFGTKNWNALSPAYLDYVNAEVLFIGEKTDVIHDEDGNGEIDEELEKLAAEDAERIKEMEGDGDGDGKGGEDNDGIFKDLELSKGEYGDGIKMEF